MSQQQEQIRTAVLAIVKRLAPEIDPAKIIADKPLRTQIDLDSMDWLNVLASIHEKLGVDIPETDYGKVQTLDSIVAYLAGKIPADSLE
ncbi:MAG: acyl carrier protein [Gammaproteobacteria bacterium]|nr:acyl carrier protein [Gammaproteobacteria bacterium]MBU1602128.1 acyl carrier protein [Gammaproteobacteria bacterium]MBU2434175.1 acyl carrier protein [Gammaproteobacteria bacterium]MBU2448501.1 acyl carrier protein [Gammaproteobacteria bacterium]